MSVRLYEWRILYWGLIGGLIRLLFVFMGGLLFICMGVGEGCGFIVCMYGGWSFIVCTNGVYCIGGLKGGLLVYCLDI